MNNGPETAARAYGTDTAASGYAPADDTPVIEAKGLSRHYGGFTALYPTDITIPRGRIVGVIGANGAGKTTMLNAILGLGAYDGDLTVMGCHPLRQRAALMRDVCFIADVATLPKWMRVSEVLDYVAGVHPRFNRDIALDFLRRTSVPLDKKVRALSKGMTVQVHLAVVMAIDARLLVLDEPTLGLDILFRKQFYQSLLEEYFDEERTILITTHQVEEVEHILSDVLFIKDGRVVLMDDMDVLSERFTELQVAPGKEAEALACNPIRRTSSLGRTVCVYRDADRQVLAGLGEVRRLGLADIFVATVEEAGGGYGTAGPAASRVTAEDDHGKAGEE